MLTTFYAKKTAERKLRMFSWPVIFYCFQYVQPTYQKNQSNHFQAFTLVRMKNIEFSAFSQNFPLKHRRKKTVKILHTHHKVYMTTQS